MNEMLQKRIEEAAKKMSHNKMSFWEDCDYSTKDIEEIIYDACKLTAVYALQNQWISVEEALPPRSHFLDGEESVKSIDVFVRYKNGAVTSAWYCYCSKVWYFAVGRKGDNSIHGEITHWMEMPSLEGGEK